MVEKGGNCEKRTVPILIPLNVLLYSKIFSKILQTPVKIIIFLLNSCHYFAFEKGTYIDPYEILIVQG